jgi:lipopolysaccharide/colanic/teichoic acid biosynthesis glycosyltransferase
VGQCVEISDPVIPTKFHSFVPTCNRGESFHECLANTPASEWIRSRIRRCIDCSLALCVLLVFAVPMLILALCIRFTSPGRVFFTQERVGKNGRLFKIFKFRSMTEADGKNRGPGLTRAGDHRVTAIGRFLRKSKFDELPQFYNVLRGDMSLIGPRPKLPQYASLVNMNYRPGITGAATIVFRCEEELMRGVDQAHLDDFYARHIKPVKVRLDVCYMCRATPETDLQIFVNTIMSCIRPVTTTVQPPLLIPKSAQSLARYTIMPQESGLHKFPDGDPAA